MDRRLILIFTCAVLLVASALSAAWGAEPRELLKSPIDPFGIPGFIRLLHDAEADELVLAVTPQDLRSTAYDQLFATWDVSAPQGVQTQPSPPMSLSTFGPWSETIRHPVNGHYRAELVLERPRTDGRLEASGRFAVAFFYNAVAASAEIDTEAAPTPAPRASRAGSLSIFTRAGGVQIERAAATGTLASTAGPDVFLPEERAISVTYSWTGARTGTSLVARWYYLEGSERLPWLTQGEELKTPEGQGRFTFLIDEDEQWFTGDYVVEISSAGQVLREVFFTVRPQGGQAAGRPLVVMGANVIAAGAAPQPAGPGAYIPADTQRVELKVVYRGGTPGQRLTSRWYFVEGLMRRSFSESTVEILRPDHEVVFAFSLRPGERWLQGNYEVDVYAGTELVVTAAYRVSSPSGPTIWPSLEAARVAVRPDPAPAGEECIVEGRGFSSSGLIPLEGIVLTDSTGRAERFRGEAIKLSPEGTFAFRFRLPLGTAQGPAQLVVTDQERRTATVNFNVGKPRNVKEQLKDIEEQWKDIFR